MAALTMTQASGMGRGQYIIGKQNGGRSTMSRTRWVLDWNTIALHARKISGESIHLIKRLCKILNGRGQISSACDVELVGERMREKPQVSSLDKNVLFACCDRVMIGLVVTKENYKIINVQQNWYKISVDTPIYSRYIQKMPIYSRDIHSERFLQRNL